VLYAIRGIFGLHGRRSQNRKEFLELWDSSRSQDELWLEIVVRHLFGAYLPARIIRLALTRPNKSQALLDLSELWPLLRFDPESLTVSWLNKRHRTQKRRNTARYILLAGYFGSALIAALSALTAFQSGPVVFSSWIYGVCAITFGSLAALCLLREDSIKLAVTVGDHWLTLINSPSEKQTQNK
jgi:hypothetical protein